MAVKHDGHQGTVTLRAGARHLFTTDIGKYIWWPALQRVDFILRGRRNPNHAWVLNLPENTKNGAMKKALRMELEAINLGYMNHE